MCTVGPGGPTSWSSTVGPGQPKCPCGDTPAWETPISQPFGFRSKSTLRSTWVLTSFLGTFRGLCFLRDGLCASILRDLALRPQGQDRWGKTLRPRAEGQKLTFQSSAFLPASPPQLHWTLTDRTKRGAGTPLSPLLDERQTFSIREQYDCTFN